MSPDPLAATNAGVSPYASFDNNPVYYRDPTGLHTTIAAALRPKSKEASELPDSVGVSLEAYAYSLEGYAYGLFTALMMGVAALNLESSHDDPLQNMRDVERQMQPQRGDVSDNSLLDESFRRSAAVGRVVGVFSLVLAAAPKSRSTKSGAMDGRRVGHTFTKHGSGNTQQLLKEAAGSGKPVGQWLDDAAAEQFIAERIGQLSQGARTFDLPPGLWSGREP